VRRLLAGGAVAVVMLAACGGNSNNGASSGGHSPAAGGAGHVAPLTVNTGNAPGIGIVLVDGRGRTLYHLKPETGDTIQCTGSCTSTWPPLLLSGGATPTGGMHVTGTLATVARPDGGTQVTYEGLTLYTYAGDSKPGQATGQGVGGVWFAVTPTGLSSSGSGGGSGSGSGSGSSPTGSTSGGGYGY
jgi:predicted lipoprotein with Yx(FWY)xxD motif